MDLAPARAPSRSVRGDEYARVRVDVAASELALGGELARGGASVVFRGTFAGAPVAVKRPSLATRADMDRYHKELQLVRRVLQRKHGYGAAVAHQAPLCAHAATPATQLAGASQRVGRHGGARVAARILPHFPADGALFAFRQRQRYAQPCAYR
jgi:hypothetical protein